MASFTKLLLASNGAAYERATKPNFLSAAASGQLPKESLHQWLANERLFFYAFIKGAGRFISSLEVSPLDTSAEYLTQLLDWAVEALGNARPEEKFLLTAAAKYGISMDLPTLEGGWVADVDKIEGLRRFEAIFGSISSNESTFLPWLESAVVLYATDKIFLDAWAWAKSQMPPEADTSADLDNGLSRERLIPRWSAPEAASFVQRLERIIDGAVEQEIGLHQPGIKTHLLVRAQAQWDLVLAAEQTFWPKL